MSIFSKKTLQVVIRKMFLMFFLSQLLRSGEKQLRYYIVTLLKYLYFVLGDFILLFH